MIYQPTTRENEQSTLEALVAIGFQYPAVSAQYYSSEAYQSLFNQESGMIYLPYIEEINPFDNELAYATGVVIGLVNQAASGNVATGWLLAAGIQSRVALSEVLGAYIAQVAAQNESIYCRNFTRLNPSPATFENLSKSGYTQYTLVQYYMALDQWFTARVEYEGAVALVNAAIMAQAEYCFPYWYYNTPEVEALAGALAQSLDKTESALLRPSLLEKTHSHSRECYTVDRTLAQAATLRNGAKKLLKALSSNNS